MKKIRTLLEKQEVIKKKNEAELFAERETIINGFETMENDVKIQFIYGFVIAESLESLESLESGKII